MFAPHKCGLVQSVMTKGTEPELGQTSSLGARCTDVQTAFFVLCVTRSLEASGVAPASGLSQYGLPPTQRIATKGHCSEKKKKRKSMSGPREEVPVNPNTFG